MKQNNSDDEKCNESIRYQLSKTFGFFPFYFKYIISPSANPISSQLSMGSQNSRFHWEVLEIVLSWNSLGFDDMALPWLFHLSSSCFLVFCATSSFFVHPQILVVFSFVFFSLHLGDLIHSHVFSCHLCADDPQGTSLFCVTIHKFSSLLSISTHLDTT